MASADDLKERVERAGLEAGLDRLGVAAAGPFGEVRADMHERIATGMNGRLRFTFKDPESATDVTRSFPWARSLVVGVRSYLPEAGHAAARPGRGRTARFAVADPYLPLRRGLEAVAHT
ncbi:MAG: hypothetical protein ACLFWM_08535, partial [Actinomycetota bacterium]